MGILENVKEKAEKWLTGNYDDETKAQVRDLMENDVSELTDAFYKDLEFGTGGLRGVMGVGTNRMNIYTVGMATQGLCNYIRKQFGDNTRISVAIAYDSRNNNKLFAETTAGVFSGNNIHVYLFDALRPTPELSFTIRHLGCKAGVVVTASHNPKEYNGYKVYWEDGGQIISPHDKNIIDEVQNIRDVEEVRFNGPAENIELIGSEIDEIYTDKIKELSLSPEIIKRNDDIKIVYTPIHGSGVKLVPMCLKKIGFTNVFNVPEQNITDGNFPTVASPNPEEPATLDMAIRKAKETDASIVMGTDPDTDRVGVAVKNNKNEFILLNGNQIASLLIYYLLTKWSENNKLTGNEYIVKTVVTTELLADIARKYNVEYFDVLTGFKYIADVIKNNEGKKIFIGGGEESYGYLAGEFVRDKDAVISCFLIAETAAWAKDRGMSLLDMLVDIYSEFDFYKERLLSIVRKGKSGAEEIQGMMDGYRNSPPDEINNSKVIMIKDYLSRKAKNIITGDEEDILLPVSNVLQLFLEDGSKISMRPSGTEPKIKFYFSVKDPFTDGDDYDQTNALLDKRIDDIVGAMGLELE